jgi:outer membrane murein-binding lipoprotein Lpp
VKPFARILDETLDGPVERHHFAVDRTFFFNLPRSMRIPYLCAALAAGVVMAGASSCVNPRAQEAVAQALNDAAYEIGGLKSDMAQLQTQMDSLREVMAKQDSLINRIAAVYNIPR